MLSFLLCLWPLPLLLLQSYVFLFSFFFLWFCAYFFLNLFRLYKSVVKPLPQEEFSNISLPISPLRTVQLSPSNSLESTFKSQNLFSSCFMMFNVHFYTRFSVQEITPSPNQPLLALASLRLEVLILVGSLSLLAKLISPNGTLPSLMTPNVRSSFFFFFLSYTILTCIIYLISYLVLLQAATTKSPLH